MGVEIKLTDKDLPVSPVFIDFLHSYIEEQDFEVSWHDQLSEVLIPAKAEEALKAAVSVADQVLQHPVGQKAIYRSYELLTAFLTGQAEKLRFFHKCYLRRDALRRSHGSFDVRVPQVSQCDT